MIVSCGWRAGSGGPAKIANLEVSICHMSCVIRVGDVVGVRTWFLLEDRWGEELACVCVLCAVGVGSVGRLRLESDAWVGGEGCSEIRWSLLVSDVTGVIMREGAIILSHGFIIACFLVIEF